MRLSIIIPVYNVEAYLEECLQSILQQDVPYNDYEIIIINDGSTDNSAAILHEAGKLHSNILIIEQENAGVSAARNAGLEIAKGNYLMFVDSDDYIESNTLNNLLTFAEQYDVDLLQYECNISGIATDYTETDQPLSTIVFDTKEEYINACFFSKEMWHAEMWRFLFKNSLIKEKCILFDREIMMGEDQLFTLQHIFYATKIAYTSQKIYNYRIRQGSAMNSFSYKHAVNQLNVAKKIKKLLKNTSKQLTKTAILFYERFINIFVVYQYVDRVLICREIKHPIKTIKNDIKAYNLDKLYYISQYQEEMKMIRLYNFSLSLYCIQLLVKKKIVRLIKYNYS